MPKSWNRWQVPLASKRPLMPPPPTWRGWSPVSYDVAPGSPESSAQRPSRSRTPPPGGRPWPPGSPTWWTRTAAARIEPSRVSPAASPAIKGEERCSLHGGVDSSNLAVPALGRLGTDTWPALIRHLRLASYDIDALGLDPVLAELAWHLGNSLYFEYFRVRVEGIENVPTTGPAVLAANHGGAAIPYDAAMIQLAVLNESAAPRRVRVVATEVFNMMPFVSHLYRKIGAAYASRQDARWVLGQGQLLGVFPEGVQRLSEAGVRVLPTPPVWPGRVRLTRRRVGHTDCPGRHPGVGRDPPRALHITHPGEVGEDRLP